MKNDFAQKRDSSGPGAVGRVKTAPRPQKPAQTAFAEPAEGTGALFLIFEGLNFAFSVETWPWGRNFARCELHRSPILSRGLITRREVINEDRSQSVLENPRDGGVRQACNRWAGWLLLVHTMKKAIKQAGSSELSLIVLSELYDQFAEKPYEQAVASLAGLGGLIQHHPEYRREAKAMRQIDNAERLLNQLRARRQAL